jgi:hypothetical protein
MGAPVAFERISNIIDRVTFKIFKIFVVVLLSKNGLRDSGIFDGAEERD